MIAGAMTFKEQCIYWHNYFRTLHQVRKETEATGLTCMTFSIIISDCSQLICNQTLDPRKHCFKI